MRVTVSKRGQITIPRMLREQLGVQTGDLLEVRESHGELLITKHPGVDAFDSVTGILKRGQITDALIEELRGPADTV